MHSSKRIAPSAAFYCLLISIAFCFFSPFAAQCQDAVKGAKQLRASFLGKTPPLRELAPLSATDPGKLAGAKRNKPKIAPPNFSGFPEAQKRAAKALPLGEDPVRQVASRENNSIIVVPKVVIEGIDEAATEIQVPDTNGDISPEAYIQTVNASYFQIFGKNGTPLGTPISTNTLWSQINRSSFGDPVILYDADAGRWLLTDLASFDEVLYAVSETGDPLGSWFIYSFQSDGFTDYPKYGIWPNAYILTVGDFSGESPVLAINRAQMLAGASQVDVQKLGIPVIPNGGYPMMTPMGWSGNTPAANNAKPAFLRIHDDAWGNIATDQVEIWTMDIDWANPGNTSLSPQFLPTAPFDSDPCTYQGVGYQCVPQPNPDMGIDAIATIIMNKVTYRNFGTHESAVLTFTVDAADNVAGIRWIELRRMAGSSDWAVYQEGTYAPNDGLQRFIGAVALNNRGDIGLGYAVSSADKFPSLRFTGRRATDPLGEMTVEEFEFASGENARTLSDRYGDYASMSVDPLDNSFWFTSEYVKADGTWGTKIVAFSLGRDSVDIQPVSILSPQNAPDLGSAETVSIQVINAGLEPVSGFSVGYVFQNGTPVLEPALTDTLFPDSVYIHTFTPPVDMSAIGAYNFKVFTVLASDQNIGNDTLRRIVRKLPRFDTGIKAVKNLLPIVCGTSANFSVELHNYGTEPLTSVDIQFTVNGSPVQTDTWTGNLPSGEKTLVPVTLNNLTAGNYTLVAQTSNPNGLTDEIPANDVSAPAVFQVFVDGVSVTLELETDFYPFETTWELRDNNNTLLYSGGPYQQPKALYQEFWCLDKASCYTFKIFDSFGDGLADDEGTYRIKDADGNILASIINVNFGDEETNGFCADANCVITADVKITNEFPAGANNGAILVTPNSGTSPFRYSKNGGQTFQIFPLFSALGSGDYAIVVKDANNCTFEQTATVKVMVSTTDKPEAYQLSVSPNPSADGIFRVEISGLPGASRSIELQVLDATGKAVQYAHLAAVDNRYAGMVSLQAYPAGMYFLRFKHDAVVDLVKVLRL